MKKGVSEKNTPCTNLVEGRLFLEVPSRHSSKKFAEPQSVLKGESVKRKIQNKVGRRPSGSDVRNMQDFMLMTPVNFENFTFFRRIVSRFWTFP